jgi:hypothetical protein
MTGYCNHICNHFDKILVVLFENKHFVDYCFIKNIQKHSIYRPILRDGYLTTLFTGKHIRTCLRQIFLITFAV